MLHGGLLCIAFCLFVCDIPNFRMDQYLPLRLDSNCQTEIQTGQKLLYQNSDRPSPIYNSVFTTIQLPCILCLIAMIEIKRSRSWHALAGVLTSKSSCILLSLTYWVCTVPHLGIRNFLVNENWVQS